MTAYVCRTCIGTWVVFLATPCLAQLYFSGPRVYSGPESLQDVAVGQIDDDDILDLIRITDAGLMTVLCGTGGASFVERSVVEVDAGPAELQLGTHFS